mmetsp:Transcript_135805/g.330123  ORF Transcript_135805/g.330123 Transcript_135805/m.330123 type:complete len:221 (-) Transcript_135805:2158-2820(-)
MLRTRAVRRPPSATADSLLRLRPLSCTRCLRSVLPPGGSPRVPVRPWVAHARTCAPHSLRVSDLPRKSSPPLRRAAACTAPRRASWATRSTPATLPRRCATPTTSACVASLTRRTASRAIWTAFRVALASTRWRAARQPRPMCAPCARTASRTSTSWALAAHPPMHSARPALALRPPPSLLTALRVGSSACATCTPRHKATAATVRAFCRTSTPRWSART